MRFWKTPSRTLAIALVAADLASAAAELHATTLAWRLDLPAEQVVRYEVEFEVAQPGLLAFDASWSGSRVLSFTLEPPGGGMGPLRRSGPPPLHWEVPVDERAVERREPWKLSIRGLPAAAAAGRLEVQLPDPPPADTTDGAVSESAPAPASEPPPVERSRLRRDPTPGLSAESTRLYETIERFRSLVAEGDPPLRDRYDWQDPLLRYVVERRDGTAGLPDETTRRMLQRAVDIVRRVERLARSTDPLVAGPAPEPGPSRRAWLSLRGERIAPLERELDALLHELDHGYATELEAVPWFARFISCLMACEHHFEERGRLGDQAANVEVVQEQWERMLAAADALASLVALAPAANATD